jgi:hypothetical protein
MVPVEPTSLRSAVTSPDCAPPASGPDAPNRAGDFLLWLLLALAIFSFPNPPSVDLDASWRMALGSYFQHGLQFGRDAIFTYGPLGFLLGRTYSGLQFWSLILWQIFQAAAFAGVIFSGGRGLTRLPRFGYFAFFLFLGVIYEDALQAIILSLLGVGMVKQNQEPKSPGVRWRAAFAGVLALIKFTNLLLAGCVVAIAAAEALARRKPRQALVPATWFAGSFLTGWVICGQNPVNLPTYFFNSWQISSGYQAAMGLPTPADPLWKGVVVSILLTVYLALYVGTHARRIFAAASATIVAALLYLNWKHGFVRSDGHMIGFFICALVPCAAFPVLLEGGCKYRGLQRGLLLLAVPLALAGIHDAIPSVISRFAGNTQGKVADNISTILSWRSYRAGLEEKLRQKKSEHELLRVKKEVGAASVDVLGFEQGIALFNDLNYQPRPVFQSYSAYTPHLIQLNADFYASNRAPQYALLKLQTIDERLPTFDDSKLLLLFPHLYEFVFSEKGYQLWRHRSATPDPTTLEPRRLRTVRQPLNQPLELGELVDQHLWAEIDLRLSLLGQLRSFFYKPPFVRLDIEDTADGKHSFRIPLTQGRAGFILNPLVNDILSYMNFSGGKPERRVRRLTLKVDDQDLRFFADRATIGLFAITPATAGAEFFQEMEKNRYFMFKQPPVMAESYTPVSSGEIDGRAVILMHAPSRMEFNIPAGATEVLGSFGFLPGAYKNGGDTNGAEFRVLWTNGADEKVIFKRLLDPVKVPSDQGLQDFRAELTGISGGRLRFVISPGPFENNAWDWTVWTGIAIR